MGPELTRRQKLVRSSLLAAVGIGLVWGTVWGRDYNFPFGPFSMYSGAIRDEIYVVELHAVTTNGEEIELPASAFGLRRSEFDRQRELFRTDPELIEAAVASYDTMNPDGPRLARLDIVFAIYELIDGRPVFQEEQTLATWQR